MRKRQWDNELGILVHRHTAFSYILALKLKSLPP